MPSSNQATTAAKINRDTVRNALELWPQVEKLAAHPLAYLAVVKQHHGDMSSRKTTHYKRVSLQTILCDGLAPFWLDEGSPDYDHDAICTLQTRRKSPRFWNWG